MTHRYLSDAEIEDLRAATARDVVDALVKMGILKHCSIISGGVQRPSRAFELTDFGDSCVRAPEGDGDPLHCLLVPGLFSAQPFTAHGTITFDKPEESA